MCGIFGYIGINDPMQACLAGLELLEYRGYDSTGIAGISQKQIAMCKKEGKLSFLKQSLNLPSLDLAIGHTRWATHGKVSDVNAHPHVDSSGSIALIHNGIIENYRELKEKLLQDGIPFTSETDSEVVVNLIAKYYQGDLVAALNKTLSCLKGIFALLVIHKDHPTEIIATASDCPLSIGCRDDGEESVISSDPNAFQGSEYNIVFLQNREIAKVKKGSIDIYDQTLTLMHKKQERLEIQKGIPSKGSFDHYMLKEIFDQPSSLQQTLLHDINFKDPAFSKEMLSSIEKLWIFACGTSAHAGLLAAILMEDLAELPTQVEIASEARYRNLLLPSNTLVLGISQSGETADTLAALREAKRHGCKTLGICNVKNSTLARETDDLLLLRAGPEISVCSTKAFTAQLSVLTLLTLHFAALRNRLPLQVIEEIREDLHKIPEHIQNVLNRVDQIQIIAKHYSSFRDFIFIGRRYMFPTALEAALKLKEIAYVNANGYPAGELKHGPIALLSSECPVIAFCANDATKDKILSNLMEIKARGAPLLAIAPDNFTEVESIADHVIYVPWTRDSLAPFASSVVGQLLAYFIAKEKGADIDHPRNLAKSVTVE